MKFERMDCGSLRNGPLAKGCEHCLVGGKMVLFVTGRRRCVHVDIEIFYSKLVRHLDSAEIAIDYRLP